MNFFIYDIVLLVLFVTVASIFLYRNRRNLKKEGYLFLYKTSWGLKLIDRVGSKYQKTLKFLSYVSISIGYILMAGILYVIVQTVYLYLTTSISQVIRAPPIAPLIPYFPKLFGLESYFPPFYFIYFILAILIVATAHEFSHGIFARRFGIRIKSTGFAFLKYFPAIFGAFVEQDDKQMKKKKKFEQMSVLSAGVFANILVTIFFYVLLFLFFSVAFSPAGVEFDTYVQTVVGVASVSMVNGVSLDNPDYNEIGGFLQEGLNEIKADGKNYVGISKISEDGMYAVMYDDAPAINAGLKGAVTHVDDVEVNSLDIFSRELLKNSPGDMVEIKTINEGVSSTFEIVLGENPVNENLPWLGVGFYERNNGNAIGKIIGFFPSYKEPNVYYEPKCEASVFVKDLLWWIVIINLLVALFNMLPVGFLDGGRFFYLTVLGITKSDKIAKKSFSLITYFILFLFVLLLIKWVFSFI